jgi:hypothetical protein
MKKCLFAFLLSTIMFACNTDESEPDMYENYIKLTNINPPSGSVINKVTDITATMKYNISPNEMEGDGFYLTIWESHASSPGINNYSGNKIAGMLTKRSRENEVIIDYFEHTPFNNKPDTVHYKYSITRITGEKKQILVWSEPVSYIINWQ